MLTRYTKDYAIFDVKNVTLPSPKALILPNINVSCTRKSLRTIVVNIVTFLSAHALIWHATSQRRTHYDYRNPVRPRLLPWKLTNNSWICDCVHCTRLLAIPLDYPADSYIWNCTFLLSLRIVSLFFPQLQICCTYLLFLQAHPFQFTTRHNSSFEPLRDVVADYLLFHSLYRRNEPMRRWASLSIKWNTPHIPHTRPRNNSHTPSPVQRAQAVRTVYPV